MYIFIPTLGYRRLSPDANIHYYEVFKAGGWQKINPGYYCSDVIDYDRCAKYAETYWAPDYYAYKQRERIRQNKVNQRAAREAQRTNN